MERLFLSVRNRSRFPHRRFAPLGTSDQCKNRLWRERSTEAVRRNGGCPLDEVQTLLFERMFEAEWGEHLFDFALAAAGDNLGLRLKALHQKAEFGRQLLYANQRFEESVRRQAGEPELPPPSLSDHLLAQRTAE